ncbi:Type cbb3 cytochrome oxidase biogenesis protein CcoG [Caenispirillum salinarum AK4]|uniref:Type cbb3 cytochrome oxidase biogenesis protein CcoG n=1 Tax=Caenispirillum salinarum AK4 TaxID=1238182 RepID=K9H256_9PROT|nr:cytochrome c oxidase accessory protein CcoG [Caenispirillum salinarum]EKV32370.1 Type cbb3 cytochrome oxidase biogenesis protein CcoG [Caenispirillum salinarum AK4]
MAVANEVAEKARKPSRPSGKKPEETQKSSLYAAYEKIYPRAIQGTFRNLKWIAMIVLLGIYFIGPWIPWDRAGDTPDQAILMDLAGRRGYFFWVEIWPQEVYYLTGVLILGSIGLFFVTALLGRVWCGFTCIQTVFTDLFVWVEKKLEGDRNKRMKFDKSRMTARKFGIKTLKITIWAAISIATAWTWMIYFNPAWETSVEIATGSASLGIYGFLAMIAGVTFLLAGWAREQVCIYMCPWPRFQAAMFDEDSLVVTYEKWRGEPRGFAKKGESFQDRGHCVDCTMCVQVCPTGIDIRNGSQLACIGCGLCIDACNQIMDRFNLPRGLITYDSTNNQVARARGEPTKYRFVRARTIIYAVLMVIVTAVMVYGLSTRATTEINVLHERSPLYVPLSDGQIRNGYTFKVLNMQPGDQTYTLDTQGIEGATLDVVGYTDGPVDSVQLPVKGDSVGTFRIYVTAPPAALEGSSTELEFVLTNQASGEVMEYDTLFAGPGAR